MLLVLLMLLDVVLVLLSLLLLLLYPWLVLAARHLLILQDAAETRSSTHVVFKMLCSMRRQLASKAMTLCVVFVLSTSSGATTSEVS